jgi:sugar phosphate permease
MHRMLRNNTSTPSYSPLRFQATRWSIYAVLVVAYMSVYFHRMAPAVVSSELMVAFGTTGAALGSLAAMYYYVYTAMQIPAGILADTVGIRVVATIGCAVAGVGSILFGISESFAAASAGRFLVGLGVSVIFVGLMKSNSVWFSERYYGRISGLTLFLGNLGSMLAAAPLAAALLFWSWREVFVALGIGSLVLGVLSLWLVRNRPEEAGFPSVREIEGQAKHRAREHHWLADLRNVAGRPRVWPGFFVNFGMAGSLFAFVGLWAIPLLRDGFGLDRAGAARYTTVALFGLACGSLAVGWLSDHMGRRRPVVMTGAMVYAVVLAAMLFGPWGPGAMAFVLFAVLGFAGGAFMITYACAKEVSPPALAGMAVSVVNTGLFLGAALMQPLFGWALDVGWDGAMQEGVRVFSLEDYRRGLWLMEGFALVGVVASWVLPETYGRQQE